MLSSGSCEAGAYGLDFLLSGRVDELTRRLASSESAEDGRPDLDEVSKDFASLFYSFLVRLMQDTVPREEDEDGPLAQGARDLVGMFLPKVVADQGGNALSCYIRENLSAQYGEHLDERG